MDRISFEYYNMCNISDGDHNNDNNDNNNNNNNNNDNNNDNNTAWSRGKWI